MIDHNSVVNHYNAVFDKEDDYLSVRLKYIIDHRYINSILELMIRYTTGGVSGHCLDLAKREDPFATISCIIFNDFDVIVNGKRGLWARFSLRSLKRTVHRMKHCDIQCFTYSTYDSPPS